MPTPFVRNHSHKEKGQRFTLGHAFSCAWQGIVVSFKTQRNMKIHCVVALIAIALGFIFRLDFVAWAVVAFCIAAVLAAECFNTAIEATVDLVTEDFHHLAGLAKDAAAGAVYLLAIGSVAVGLIIYIPAFLRWLEMLEMS